MLYGAVTNALVQFALAHGAWADDARLTAGGSAQVRAWWRSLGASGRRCYECPAVRLGREKG